MFWINVLQGVVTGVIVNICLKYRDPGLRRSLIKFSSLDSCLFISSKPQYILQILILANLKLTSYKNRSLNIVNQFHNN